MTEPALMQIIANVKSNFGTKGYKLPIATADLGDNWDSTLARAVDVGICLAAVTALRKASEIARSLTPSMGAAAS